MPANRRPVPKEQRREELLVAAAQLFVQDGYEAASMSRIAKQAGVTANTLYWYFADKDELLVAVADAYLQALLHEHQSAGEQASGRSAALARRSGCGPSSTSWPRCTIAKPPRT